MTPEQAEQNVKATVALSMAIEGKSDFENGWNAAIKAAGRHVGWYFDQCGGKPVEAHLVRRIKKLAIAR